jgi:hypothetical protein
MIERLEAEGVTLRKYLQKKDMQQVSTKTLDKIINNQRPYYDRTNYDTTKCRLRNVQAP